MMMTINFYIYQRTILYLAGGNLPISKNSDGGNFPSDAYDNTYHNTNSKEIL